MALFVNTFTSDEKYFPGNKENLPQPNEMHLSKKVKIFSEFFSAFLKSTFNFKHVERKYEFHSLCLPETIDSDKSPYLNV